METNVQWNSVDSIYLKCILPDVWMDVFERISFRFYSFLDAHSTLVQIGLRLSWSGLTIHFRILVQLNNKWKQLKRPITQFVLNVFSFSRLALQQP